MKTKTAPTNATAPTTPSTATPSTATIASTASVTGVANGNNAGRKVDLQASYLALIAGLLAEYQPTDVFHLPLGTMTRDELIAHFQSYVAAAEGTKDAYQAWRTAVQEERAAEQQVAPLRTGMKSILEGRFTRTGLQLRKYGFQPRKAAGMDTKTRSTMVAKALATREARGTKGRVKRLVTKGNVTGVLITPVTSDAPAPQPASSEPSVPVGASAPTATGNK